MNIKQEFKEDGKECISFTYIGDFEGVKFDGSNIFFIKDGQIIKFYITEVEELLPYFQRWCHGNG